MIGAPARDVFVCGSDAVTEPCIRAIEALGETYEITRLERKTPLVLESEASEVLASTRAVPTPP